jgi:hypothetical protein
VDLGLNPALCNWVLDFLNECPQVVKVGNNTSTSLNLNTGAPQGCLLSPLLYSLFNHEYIKFLDDTTIVGQITKNDETAYREEARAMAEWCPEKNLSLNISKTKELIVDFRKKQKH